MSPGLSHFLGLKNGFHPLKILFNARTDDQVIKMFPLRDFLPGHTQPFLNDRAGIKPTFLKALLQDPNGGSHIVKVGSQLVNGARIAEIGKDYVLARAGERLVRIRTK